MGLFPLNLFGIFIQNNMITEDYVSLETAKLLKEKGFDEKCNMAYFNKTLVDYTMFGFCLGGDLLYCPTLQMAMKWLREVHSILLVVDYDYECTNTSYCYKIYKLGEHGKPERVAINGIYYDKNGNPTTQVVCWRDYERSYSDYGTYEEACEAAIKYCLENLV